MEQAEKEMTIAIAALFRAAGIVGIVGGYGRAGAGGAGGQMDSHEQAIREAKLFVAECKTAGLIHEEKPGAAGPQNRK